MLVYGAGGDNTKTGTAGVLYSQQLWLGPHLGLNVLVGGLILVRLLSRLLKNGLTHLPIKPALRAAIRQAVSILLNIIVIGITADRVGAKSANLIKLFIVAALAAAGVILVFRPYLPSLPFKIGNTIKMGSVLGKVEGTTFLNTRLRTFDGKTVWISNRTSGMWQWDAGQYFGGG